VTDALFSGFKELFPQFAIQNAGADQSRLPTASTCVNLLKVRPVLAHHARRPGLTCLQLPQYTNEKVMRTKLLQAINANAGFDLS
jgi:ubiquitin-protein ligase E3 C